MREPATGKGKAASSREARRRQRGRSGGCSDSWATSGNRDEARVNQCWRVEFSSTSPRFRVPYPCRVHTLTPNEEEFLWRGADTKTVLNGTAASLGMEF